MGPSVHVEQLRRVFKVPVRQPGLRASWGIVGVAVAFGALLLLITRLVWVTNLRKYAGASA